jgi:hypothetical protein
MMSVAPSAFKLRGELKEITRRLYYASLGVKLNVQRPRGLKHILLFADVSVNKARYLDDHGPLCFSAVGCLDVLAYEGKSLTLTLKNAKGRTVELPAPDSGCSLLLKLTLLRLSDQKWVRFDSPSECIDLKKRTFNVNECASTPTAEGAQDSDSILNACPPRTSDEDDMAGEFTWCAYLKVKSTNEEAPSQQLTLKVKIGMRVNVFAPYDVDWQTCAVDEHQLERTLQGRHRRIRQQPLGLRGGSCRLDRSDRFDR